MSLQRNLTSAPGEASSSLRVTTVHIQDLMRFMQNKQAISARAQAKAFSVATSFRIQDLMYFIRHQDEKTMGEYLKKLVADEAAGRITKQELRDLFETQFDEGLTGLQWMLKYANDRLSAQVMLMFMSMGERGIFTSVELLQLLVQMNEQGRNAYDYAWLNGSQHARESVAHLVGRIFSRGIITAEAFQQILNPSAQTGRPLLARLMQAGKAEKVVHYFAEWQASLKDAEACKRYAAALTQPYKLMGVSPQAERQTSLQELLVCRTVPEEILDLYFSQLRFCHERGALSATEYFKALTDIKIAGDNPLRYLARLNPGFLARYLQELQFCALHGLASLQDLIEVFRPLALNGSDLISNASELVFANKKVAACFQEILRLNRDPARLVETLPGLRSFNIQMRFACSFGASPVPPTDTRPASTAAPVQELMAESKREFKHN